MDMEEKLLFGFIGIMIAGLITVGVIQGNENRSLEQQAIECQKKENTKDYLLCVAPIRQRQKENSEAADEAAETASIMALFSVAASQ